MIDAQDFETLLSMMKAGGHATIAGVLRAALFHYGAHFEQQGLVKLPPGAFKLGGRKV